MRGSAKSGRRAHYAWAVTAAACLAQFVEVVGHNGIGTILPYIAQDLGIGISVAASIAMSFALGQAFGAFLWGGLADKIGLRKAIGFSALSCSIAIISLGVFAHSLIVTCAVNAVVGVTSAGVRDATMPKLISAWYAPNMRGRGIAPVSFGGALAGAVLGVALPLILSTHSWNFAYVSVGVIGVVVSIVVFAVVRDSPASVGTIPCGYGVDAQGSDSACALIQPEGRYGKDEVMEAVKSPFAWKLGFVYFFTLVSLTGYMNYVVTAAMTGGFDIVAAGLCISVTTIAMCVSQVLFSTLTDVVPIKYVLGIMYAGSATGMLLLCFALEFVAGWLAVYVCCAFVGLFFGNIPVLQTQCAELFPVKIRGAGSGVVATVGALGGVLGPLVAGVSIGISGSTFGFFFSCTGASLAAGALSLACLPKTGGKYGDPFLNADGSQRALGEVHLV